MEPKRLILAPQFPIRMRYQEWWAGELEKNLSPFFDKIVLLGHRPEAWGISNPGHFSVTKQAVENELLQIQEYLELDLGPKDVLLHCDLSFPGIFHSVLFYTKKIRTVVFCHATSLNRYDFFQKVRNKKWPMEKTTAKLYDSVLVATKYHKKKLGWPNVHVLGGLPNPPNHILPKLDKSPRSILYASVFRPSPQKVDVALEKAFQRVTGVKIRRYKFYTWKEYYQFLDRVKFLVITAKEETYGYQVVDTLLRGCIPIAPKAYSYPELLPAELLYNPGGSRDDKIKEIIKITKKVKDKTFKVRNTKTISQFYINLVKVLKGKKDGGG